MFVGDEARQRRDGETMDPMGTWVTEHRRDVRDGLIDHHHADTYHIYTSPAKRLHALSLASLTVFT